MSLIDDADDTTKDALKRARAEQESAEQESTEQESTEQESTEQESTEQESADDSDEDLDEVYPDDERDTSGEVPVENLE